MPGRSKTKRGKSCRDVLEMFAIGLISPCSLGRSPLVNYIEPQKSSAAAALEKCLVRHVLRVHACLFLVDYRLGLTVSRTAVEGIGGLHVVCLVVIT